MKINSTLIEEKLIKRNWMKNIQKLVMKLKKKLKVNLCQSQKKAILIMVKKNENKTTEGNRELKGCEVNKDVITNESKKIEVDFG